METLIELYVNEPFDNLSAALVFKPERVVFLSGGFMPDKVTREGMVRFIKAQCNQQAEVRFIDVGNRSLGSLFGKIGDVVEEFPDCAIDMTGGPTGMLIAAHRYCIKRKTKAFFYDERRERYINIYGMAEQIECAGHEKLNAQKIISMGGGLVTGNGHSIQQYSDNEECVRKILDIYSGNLTHWNAFSEYLQFGCKHYYDSATGLFMAPSTLLNNSILLFANKRLLKLLEDAGAVSELIMEGENIRLRFKNVFIRELLTTVGMCLEMFIYVCAMDSGYYDSVHMSVVFDWDGVFHNNFSDTTNEIDVIMTHGLTASFVSCKSARPDTRDLYEISYLAGRFGGKNANVILATAVDLSGDAWAIYMRARDMGVVVIERSDIEKGREHVAEMLRYPKWIDERPDR